MMLEAEIMEMMRMLWIVIIPIAIIQFVLFITALVSIVRKKAATNDKMLWILLIIFVGIIGPIVYFAIGAKQLDGKVDRRDMY